MSNLPFLAPNTTWKTTDLLLRNKSTKYAFNILLGTLLDRSREVLTEHGTEKLVGMASQATGKAQKTAVRWISATRISLPLSLNLGVGFESGKKGLEQWWDGHNENVKQQEAARVKDANAKKSEPTKNQTKR